MKKRIHQVLTGFIIGLGVVCAVALTIKGLQDNPKATFYTLGAVVVWTVWYCTSE